MSSIDFFSNTFEEHPMGSYALYGLNTFNCDSIIQYDGEIWQFIHYKGKSEIPTFINKDGIMKEIDLRNTKNVKRMRIKYQ
jgi:hypothetical protein